MGSSVGAALVLVVNSLGGLYILAILIRFLLQASKADFYNPVSQALVKVTTPARKPFRRIIPGYKGLDFASLVLALLLNTAATCLMIIAAGYALPDIGTIVSWSFLGIVSFILNIYFYGLLISIVASWIAPFSGNPVLLLVVQLLEPIQSRFRKIIPPMGGLDLSPIFIFLSIRVLEIIIVDSVANGLRLPAQYVIGI